MTFLDLHKHKGPFRKTHKAEPKTGALYKTAASAAERSKSHPGNDFSKVLYYDFSKVLYKVTISPKSDFSRFLQSPLSSDLTLYLFSKYYRALTLENLCQRAFRSGAKTMQRATTTASALRSTTKTRCCNSERTKPSGFSTAEALPQGTNAKSKTLNPLSLNLQAPQWWRPFRKAKILKNTLYSALYSKYAQ